MSDIQFNAGVIRPVECFKEGWELIKDQYWLLFAVALVGALIGGISMYILLGAMACGICLCYLQAIDGKQVSFDDLFKGFSYFGRSFLLLVFIILPVIIFAVAVTIPFLMTAMAKPQPDPDEMMALLIGMFIGEIIFSVVMVCFHTLLMFAFPLLVDRNLSSLAAAKLSARAVWRNLSGVAGLAGVSIVLYFLGALACGFGAYFVIPIIIAGNLVAYRKVFPSSNRNPNQPPTPDAYPGAGSYT